RGAKVMGLCGNCLRYPTPRLAWILSPTKYFPMKNHALFPAAVILIVVGCNSNDSKPPPENSKMPPQTAFDISRCYPYVVPKDYLQHQPDDEKGLVRPFGHGLFVLLVQDQDGLVKNVTPDDLAAAKMTAESAHEKALDNLQNLFASGKIK